ncbi:aldose epimerase family protein [Planococcus sp. NCCP-2050]|uniref:aldose epimerase family protein n=1 Tax=Planococcus sp. NCCP-2050 TaxID=2944679 RepID=UPI00203CCEE8|nr:aldose epimerase family protein [Planococcus sp. NCCP-2050]GKW45924.1 aldose 1-epimerase [Planococcus sp. NCCP-2050]
MKVEEKVIGTVEGEAVKAFTVSNSNGVEATFLEWGCAIQEIRVPDREGKVENVVLGYETLDEYVNDQAFLGVIVGRVAGRIQQAVLTIDGESLELPANDGNNTLHGGSEGFHRKVWNGQAEVDDKEVRVRFTYISEDGEEGFPGRLETEVVYTLNEQNELAISYRAVTDKKTAVNLTNHSYFNLSGDLKRNALEHVLTMESEQFVELDSSLIPTGNALNVEDSVFDFRNGRIIEEGVESKHPQIEMVGGGYDHPFLLNGEGMSKLKLEDPESGRVMEVETDRPAVIFFSGNNLDGDIQLKERKSERHLGICLETQVAPGNLAAILLDAGEVFESKTVFRFKN